VARRAAKDETHPPPSVGFSSSVASLPSSNSRAAPPLSAASLHHRLPPPFIPFPSIRCALDVRPKHRPGVRTASFRSRKAAIRNDRPRDAERRCDPRSLCLRPTPLPNTATSRVPSKSFLRPQSAASPSKLCIRRGQALVHGSASAAPCKARSRCCPSPNTVHGSTASWVWPPGALPPEGELRTSSLMCHASRGPASAPRLEDRPEPRTAGRVRRPASYTAATPRHHLTSTGAPHTRERARHVGRWYVVPVVPAAYLNSWHWRHRG
jgi:hypothetical protein